MPACAGKTNSGVIPAWGLACIQYRVIPAWAWPVSRIVKLVPGLRREDEQ
ncbi:MAG: hypothetical protein WBN66_13195 [Smithella sp.]